MIDNPQTDRTVEERVARHLAARDWLTTEERWDSATASFRAEYLAAAREVIALVQPAVPVPPTTHATDEGRRSRYADAVRTAGDTAYGNRPFYEAITDAVIALADTELAARRAEVLRDAEEICDEAGASYTDRALNEHADAAYTLMERFRRKAEEAEQTADAVPVRAATPPPVSRADVLHEAAIGYAEILGNVPDHSADPRYWQAIRDVIVGLRRMAAEAQQQADTGTREGRCGAWGGCPLPIGHNRGRADIPENHHGLSDDLFTGPQWETHDPEAEERERDIQRESQ